MSPSLKMLWIAAMAALLSCPAWASSPTDTVTAFHAALAAGRTEQALALLSPQVQIFEAGHAERSRDEYAAHHLAADAEFAKATRIKVLHQQEQLAGASAVVLRETETTGSYKGSSVHVLGLETMVLQQQGEGWVIGHIHWSSRKPGK